MNNRYSRREFVRSVGRAASAAAIGPTVLSACAHGPGRRISPNEKVAVGYIGVGRRSGDLMRLPEDGVIVAYADVNQKRLDALKAKNPSAATYRDYREMLASKDIDAVIIATPDHWHALPTIHACEAGKDVYVEKPLSLTIREGRAMVEAARKHGRIVQTGSQQRSTPTCQKGCELVRQGRIGKVHTVHAANYPSPWECDLPEEPVPDGLDWDTWLGQTQPRGYHRDLYLPRADNRQYPDGRPLGWISYRPYSGGEMTGWGAHGLDIIQWGLGMTLSGPSEIWLEEKAEGPIIYFGKESKPTPGMEPLIRPVTMKYANGVVLKLDGKGPGGGGVFEGDAGSMLVDRGKYSLTIGDKQEDSKDPEGTDDTKNHLRNWIECIRSRKQSAADVEFGHRSATVCHLGNIARWVGHKLTWDPAKERFVNDEEANTFLERPMRAPWRI